MKVKVQAVLCGHLKHALQFGRHVSVAVNKSAHQSRFALGFVSRLVNPRKLGSYSLGK